MEPTEYDLMDEAEQNMWWYRALHARLATALAGIPGPILDAGCGTGGLLARLGRSDCVGLEYDARAARRAAAKSGVAIVQGSVNAMPFRDGAFAAIVSADVLCHAAVDPAAALAELRRVLRPGGMLVLNLPSYQWLLSAHDHRVHNTRRFTAHGARALLANAGFHAVRTRYWNGLLLPLMVVQRKLFARSDNAASDVAPFSPWLNASLHGITALERCLPFPLPAGGSLSVVAKRSDGPPS
jgi:SAM-dependent methyltransferase